MSEVYIYDSNCDDFDSIGICGALDVTECSFHEIGNGNSTLTIKHPLDKMKRYTTIIEDRILKVAVPVRNAPELDDSGAFVSYVDKYRVKSGAGKANRYLYNGKDTEKHKKKKKLVPENAEIIIIRKYENDSYRWKANYIVTETRKYKKTANGHKKGEKYTVEVTYTGWIDHSDNTLEYIARSTVEANQEGLEKVSPSWVIKSQLFRIYSVSYSESEVTAEAQHISYDATYNMTTFYTYESIEPQEAFDSIVENCLDDCQLEIRTNMTGSLAGHAYNGKDPITAVLDPDIGIVSKWKGKLIRDDYALTVLSDCGVDRGVRFEYGKNLTGIEYKVDTTDIRTAVRPEGETKKGERLFLEKSYITNSDFTALTEVSGNKKGLIYSSVFGSLNSRSVPFERIYELKGNDCKEEKGKLSKEAVINRLKEQSLAYFKEGASDPKVTVEIDFIELGNSIEFARYKDLEKVFLWDYCTVYYAPFSLNLSVQVIEIEWDCILDRATKFVLGNIVHKAPRVMSWQISGLDGRKVAPNTIDTIALLDDCISENLLQENSVSTLSIQDEAVTADTISKSAVTVEKLASETNVHIKKLAADEISAATINVNQLNAEVATIKDGYLDNAKVGNANIDNASIDTAKIKNLSADVAEIVDASIGSATIQTAQISDLSANVATIKDGYINNAKISDANIDNASIGTAKIKNLSADVAEIVDASIESATIQSAQISDLSANVASITNTAIANGTISNVGIGNAVVSAINSGSMSASTLDAGNINVINLNASNINTGSLNGVRIAKDSVALDKLTEKVTKDSDFVSFRDDVNGRITNMNTSIATNTTNIATVTSTANEHTTSIAKLQGQVVGTNLLRGSSFTENDRKYWQFVNGTRTTFGISGGYENGTYARINGVTSANTAMYEHYDYVVPCSDGEKFTASLCSRYSVTAFESDAYVGTNIAYLDSDKAWVESISVDGFSSGMKVGTVDWRKVTKTITVPSGKGIKFLRFRSYAQYINGYYDIQWAKIESGDSATDWSPSPLDITETAQLVNTVKQTAEGNTSTISALTKTVTDNYTTLSNKYTEVKSTADGVSATVSSMKIGGANLIIGSGFTADDKKYWTFSNSSVVDFGQSWTNINGTQDGYSAKITGNSSESRYFYNKADYQIPCAAQQEYTISFDYKSSITAIGTGTESLPPIARLYIRYYNANKEYLSLTTNILTIENKVATIPLTHVEETFKVYNSADIKYMHVFVLFRYYNGYLSVHNLQLESGNKATAYSPSYADVKQSAIDISAEAIKTALSSGGINSQYTQTADGFTWTVDDIATKNDANNIANNVANNIEIAVENLVRGSRFTPDDKKYWSHKTGDNITYHNSGGYNGSGYIMVTGKPGVDSYAITNSTYAIPCKSGDVFTATLYCRYRIDTIDASGAFIGTYASYRDSSDAYVTSKTFDLGSSKVVVGVQDWKRYQLTFTVPSNSNIVSMRIDIQARNFDGHYDVCLLKVEKGNKATGYSVSPKDVELDIGTAQTTAEASAKTATNFMSFNSDVGLMIGDRTSGGLVGYRIQVKPNDGINMYTPDGISIASYGSSVRVGRSDNKRININDSSVTGYNASNKKYFEITESGITLTPTSGSSKNLLPAVGVVNLASPYVIGYQTATGTLDGFEYTQTVGSGAGLKFPAEMFEIGADYVLSFKLQKQSGTLTYIGGHSAGFTTNKIVVNGAITTGVGFGTGVKVSDTTSPIDVVVYLTFNGNASDNKLYIQPQRGNYHSSNDITVKYFDIQLEKGTVRSSWSNPILVTNFIDLSDNGITVGNKTGGEFKGYRTVMDSDGVDIENANGATVAHYGDTARIGTINGSNLTINSKSLTAQDSSGKQYFVVSSNGISLGSDTNFVIGDKTKKHIQISNDSVDIMNNTSVNASFGDNEVAIGGSKFGSDTITLQDGSSAGKFIFKFTSGGGLEIRYDS